MGRLETSNINSGFLAAVFLLCRQVLGVGRGSFTGSATLDSYTTGIVVMRSPGSSAGSAWYIDGAVATKLAGSDAYSISVNNNVATLSYQYTGSVNYAVFTL